MKKLLFILTIIMSQQLCAQNVMQWQTHIPTSYDYNDLQILSSNTIVAVGLAGTFIRSDDAGVTWKYVYTNTLVNLTGVDFTDNNIGYACGDRNGNIYAPAKAIKTIDGGITWDTLNVPFSAAFCDIDFVSADTGWIVGDSCKIFHTVDGGLNWTNQSFAGIELLNFIFMVNADTGFVAGDDGLVYRTYNSGNTWTPCPPSTSNMIHSLFFLDGQNGWCTADNEMIFHTSDGGDHWNVQLNGGSTTPVMSICFLDSLNGHALSTAFTYHTSNGGQTWHTENNGYHYNAAMAFSDTANGFTAGPHGNIQKTVDAGNIWTDVAGESNFYDYNNIQFTDAVTGYCVGDYGKMRKTADAGSTWTFLPTSSLFDIKDLFFLNNNLGYVAGETGSVKKTIDGGQSFTNVNTGGTEDLYAVFFLNADTGWVSGNNCVYKTTNGGTSWVPQTLPSFTYGGYDIVFTDASTGYIASWANRIYKTTNGGDVWTEIPNLPSVSSIIKLQFLNADTGWASSDAGYIMKTVDAGQTWTIQNMFCFAPAYAFHFYDALNGVAGGGIENYNCKLYRTRDGGATWENTNIPLVYDINGLWMADTSHIYLCADYGTIILYGDSINMNVGLTHIDVKENMVHCFPNPVLNYLNVELSPSCVGENIFIYNSIGELVKTFPFTKNNIDVSSLKEGMYFLRVNDYKGKFIKQ